MIDGVAIKQLKVWPDDRGFLMEVLRNDDKFYKKFGQTTFTLTHPGIVKAFHWHKKQDDLWFIASGMAQIVLHDLRKKSKTYKETQVIFAGDENRVLIKIPSGVAHGYKVIGTRPAMLFYHTSEVYNPKDPDEERLDFDDPKIGFDWQTKNR